MSKIVLIQGSMNPESKTSIVLDEVEKTLSEKNIPHELVDLRKLKLEFCDGRKLDKYNSDLQDVYKKMEEASGYIIGMPVYCYSIPGPLKNFLDITIGAMEGKNVGIVCNAGGIMSYLASADLMKVLSYEVHATSVQPTVYSYYADFKDGKVINQKVLDKAQAMIAKLVSSMA